uniref:ATP synthase complex subunit 8 n=2 Tax=Mastacembelidae TaxID=94233 RepID=A0A0U1Z7G5_9TELE|nr:ATP synthase F0 subunit 8 [Sinobdella sinensis]YP_009154857.1 ATP synthase F0 subunit 8 [Macrognathus aculeatus]AHA12484.1 ATP synthase F0 subunit 8 [Macrognathus aculeatus]AJP76440.1 ATP synthase F0 subunit 8 [Sinobdella sinensis]ALK27140.1 ATP synthase F0 subunit 8 [Macrognathus aculeatus]QVY58587.1 ATP synthase F0 subunit 8 [Sinobdella sinensis]
MPQLNPAPWFAILIFSWLIFLTIITTKTTTHTYPNELSPQDKKAFKTESWNWPWY